MMRPFLYLMFLASFLAGGTVAAAEQNAGTLRSTTVPAERDPLARAAQLNSNLLKAVNDRKYSEAFELAREAIQIRRKLLGERHPDTVLSLANYGFVLHLLGRNQEAEVIYKQVVSFRSAALGEVHPDTLSSIGNYAYLLALLDRSEEAELLYARRVLLSRINLGDQNFDTLRAISDYAVFLNKAGRYSEAEPLFVKALSVATKWLGDQHPFALEMLRNRNYNFTNLHGPAQAEELEGKALILHRRFLGYDDEKTLMTLNRYASILMDIGKFDEAIASFSEELELRQKSQGENHPDTIIALSNYAVSLSVIGQYDKALSPSLEALMARQKVIGERHKDTLASIDQYGFVLNALGKHDEAAKYANQALTLRRKTLGERHAETLRSLRSVASILRSQGRIKEAEAFIAKALLTHEQVLGDTHLWTLSMLGTYAVVLNELGRHSEAEMATQFILNHKIRVFGKNDYRTATALHNHAFVLYRLNRHKEAEKFNAEALRIKSEAFGKSHITTLTSLSFHGLLLSKLGRKDEAEEFLKSSLEIRLSKHRESSIDTLKNAADLGNFYNSWPAATISGLSPSRLASSGLRERIAALGPHPQNTFQAKRDGQRYQSFFKTHSNAAWSARLVDPVNLSGYRVEAFISLQDAMSGSASHALAQMAARQRAQRQIRGLGELARERQSLSGQWLATERQITGALADTSDVGRSKRDAARARIADIEKQMEILDARLRAEAPEYFALIRPEPLELLSAQELLGDDEAALMLVPTEHGTHVMVVSDAGLKWHRSDLNEEQVEGLVATLRRDLDPPANGGSSSQLRSYDRQSAYRLYQELIAPVADALAGKTEVYVAADDALASLPLGVLVTEAPEGDDADPAALRATSWLADKYALVQIPSLQSLGFLRQFRSKDNSSSIGQGSSFAGFGDPVLEGDAVERGRGALSLASDIYAPGRTRAGGGIADIARLRQLARLPGTRVELTALRTVFQAPEDAIKLGASATEEAVRMADLSNTNVIAFATHGLLAGELDGVSEPGLVFTPPDEAKEENDGLLTASEIAALRLDADWVILSACNTAAGDGAGGGGLSGLARAFFYAGTRSLLASHWPVRDDIAVRLSVITVSASNDNPEISRAQALQQAMREVRNTIADPSTAHPSVWAPFTIVGEGR